MVLETSYIIEGEVTASLLRFAKDNYKIKDVNNHLLGCTKRREASLKFEGASGTPLGEIRAADNDIAVYDAQNQLLGTIKQEQHPASEGRRFRFSNIILFPPIILGLVSLAASILMLVLLPKPIPRPFDLFFLVCFFGGFALAFGGIIYMQFKTAIEVAKIKWLIEDSKGRILAVARQASKFYEKYQISNLDGDLIAQIGKQRGFAAFRNSYRIDVSRPSFDPLLILSYAVMIAERYRAGIRDVI